MQVYAPHPSELKPIIDHEHLVNNSLLAFSLAISKALPARFFLTCAAMAIIILNLCWVLAVATRYRELVIENMKSSSCRAGDHNTDFPISRN